jgi:hypothetical protein
MKRAKIMLFAIAAVAAMGGALAFKAQTYIDMNVFCATRNAQSVIYCTTTSFRTAVEGSGTLVTTPCITWHNAIGLGATRTSSYYTTTQDFNGNPCPNPLRASARATILD